MNVAHKSLHARVSVVAQLSCASISTPLHVRRLEAAQRSLVVELLKIANIGVTN